MSTQHLFNVATKNARLALSLVRQAQAAGRTGAREERLYRRALADLWAVAGLK